MQLKSTSTQYGRMAISLHWLSALGAILAFAAGFSVVNLAPPERQAPILVVHIVLGLIVFALTLLRLLWWLAFDRHPGAPAGQPRWQALSAQIVHVGLYVLLILMATSGIATVLLSGALPTLLAGGPVPDLSEVVPRIAHGVMSKLLLLLFVVHVGAAIYHQVIRGDRLLARMGLGRA